MKTITTIAAISALGLASQVMAAPLHMSIYTQGNQAEVIVTEDGQPAAGVPVTVEGLNTQVLKTSEHGNVIVSNFDDNARTYTFSVEQQDGSVIETKRFLSRQH
ncbi:hypothetical protein OAP63_18595 [Vibrio sp.]|uniref:DUF4198 domain-containing protein n=1 Tax=Vibrio viridaestus TaxID=2487322 RepID=A0A3N9TJC2_9VIBR|nr:hypothetical protein [Vibrio viridaestus]MDC0612743.1 hypothetical protein [Vibrio sp.]RQW64409.1 hypothetical protein EES38_07490 [Vibrio viridaestus]